MSTLTKQSLVSSLEEIKTSLEKSLVNHQSKAMRVIDIDRKVSSYLRGWRETKRSRLSGHSGS